MSGEHSYIPFETTAKIIARGETSNEEFLRSLFPDRAISEAEIYKFEQFVAGKIHDGIELGSGLSNLDPITALEAYRFGAEEGRDRVLGEIRQLHKGDS